MLECVLAESEEGCVKNRSFERERLSDADLSEAEFERVRFKKCVFEGCRFSSSAFYGAEFENCIFSGCSFSEGYFRGCNFSVCKGDGCNFSESRFKDGLFEDSSFCYADFTIEGQPVQGFRFSRIEVEENDFGAHGFERFGFFPYFLKGY